MLAGLFFAFSAFVMTSLARLPAEQGIAAMQSINITILRSVFIVIFMGTSLLCVILGITSLFNLNQGYAVYVIAGCLFLIVGTFLVTIIFNVPLNDRLASAIPGSPEGAQVWLQYLADWVPWNHVRTIASIASLASLIIALRKW